MFKKAFAKLNFALVMTALLLPNLASAAYVVAGASSSLTPGSGSWAWDGYYMQDFRAALENPNFFGPTGVVNESISTVTLNSVTTSSLSGIDMFISPWLKDSDGPAFSADVINFFHNGGDLFLLQDSSGWDYLGQQLGIPTLTTPSTGSVSNGTAPFFDGAFGKATDVTQHYQVGQIDPTVVTSLNGNVIGTNIEGQVTSAYWEPGTFSLNSGALFLIADVDMIASKTSGCGLAECGAVYGPTLSDLNDNAVYALNTFSFIQSGGELSAVPVPAAVWLFAPVLLGFMRLRSKYS